MPYNPDGTYVYDPEVDLWDESIPNEQKRSSAQYLKKLRKEFGIKESDYDDVVKPKVVELPTFREKTSKEVKRHIKETKRRRKKDRYKIAYWYLENYCSRSYANEIYAMYHHDDFELMVDRCVEEAMGTIQILQLGTKEVDMDELYQSLRLFHNPELATIDDSPMDISDEDLWEEFERYCEKHPIDDVRDICKRREKFFKKRTKARKKLYSVKRMKMYDPLFKRDYINRKEMVSNMRRIAKDNEARVEKFKELMSHLIKDDRMGAEVMAQFNKQTEEMLKRSRKRLNAMLKAQGKKFPSHVQVDFTDSDGNYESIVYDDWDNPDAIDSVLKIPCRDI